MSKSTFKILFYLRKNQVNKDGTVSIMVRVFVNGEVAQFRSKLNLDPSAWDVTRAKAAGTTFESKATQRAVGRYAYLYCKPLSVSFARIDKRTTETKFLLWQMCMIRISKRL